MVEKGIIIKSIDNAISKCSDGTTLSKPLRKSLNNFKKEYGGLTDHEELSVFDNQGNLITHEKGEGHSVGLDDDKLKEEGYTELHITHNHPTLFQDKVPTYLSEGDLESFIFEDMFKSITAVSPNDTSMTLIKNKDFVQNKDNETQIWNAMLDLTEYSQSYYSLYRDYALDYMTERAVEYEQNHPGQFIRQTAFREEASQHTIEKMGTLEQYLKKKGVYDSLNKVNVKLRINI